MKFFETKEQRKEHSRELFLKYFGYGAFALIFTIVCVLIFIFLPEDAQINKEVSLFNTRQENIEDKELALSPVNPAEYHSMAVSHKRQKDDPGLRLYRKEATRQSVVWFYVQITGNQDVALAILKSADKNDIPVSLAFALAWTESNYKANAVSGNANLSVDRGLFQLNNRSFPDITEEDFFNPYKSAEYGLSHLRYCLDAAGNEIGALAMYNAGTTKVKSNKTPQSTLNYVSKIMNYKEGLDILFNSHVASSNYSGNKSICVASIKK